MPATAPTSRFAFRATPTDLAHLASIAAALREAGESFATRTDAMRHALEEAAAALAVPSKASRP